MDGKMKYMVNRQSVLKSVLDEQKKKYPFLFCVETGCIRSLKDADGHSTKVFGELLKDGILHSFELNRDHIEIAKQVCNEYLDHIIFHQGDSRELLLKVLEEVNPRQVHVAYLDSANDADLIFEEFKVIEPYLKSGSALVVDDITCPSCKKGKKILPYLRSKEEWEVELFDVANGMLVCYKR